jgi:hypothetical protein
MVLPMKPATKTKIQEILKKTKSPIIYTKSDDIIDDAVEYFYNELKKSKLL